MLHYLQHSRRASLQPVSVVLAFAASGLGPAGMCTAGNVSAPDAVVVAQRHSSMGKVVTTVGKSGVRIELPKQQCVLVSSPPDWKITLFNVKAKTKYQQSFTQLEKNPIFLIGENVNRIPTKVIQTPKASKNSIPMIVREAPANFKLDSELWDRTQVGVDRRHVKRVYFFSYDDKSKIVPERARALINSIYGFPPNLGLVIGLKYQFRDGQTASVIEPSSLKPCTTVATDFTVPAGLKPARMRMEVLSAGVSNLVEGWAEDMGLGEVDHLRDRSSKKSK